MQRTELINAGIASLAIIILLSILFGTTGLIIAAYALAVAKPAYYALRKLGMEEHIALSACLPFGLIAAATITYPLSFLVGIRMGALIAAAVLIATIPLIYFGSANLKKARTHRSA